MHVFATWITAIDSPANRSRIPFVNCRIYSKLTKEIQEELIDTDKNEYMRPAFCFPRAFMRK